MSECRRLRLMRTGSRQWMVSTNSHVDVVIDDMTAVGAWHGKASYRGLAWHHCRHHDTVHGIVAARYSLAGNWQAGLEVVAGTPRRVAKYGRTTYSVQL